MYNLGHFVEFFVVIEFHPITFPFRCNCRFLFIIFTTYRLYFSAMVFESVVAEVLNRVLGNFVNNLDASQLNIGIWGGMFSFLFSK